MEKGIILAVLVAVTFLVSVFALPRVSPAVLANPALLGTDAVAAAFSLLILAAYFAMLAISSMVEIKKPFSYGIYAAILVSALSPLILVGASKSALVMCVGVLVGSFLYYTKTGICARNMIHLSAFGASESSLHLSISILAIAFTVAVFLASTDINIVSLVPDELIGATVGMLEGQVSSLGCSLSQTVAQCAASQANNQLAPQRQQLLLQCETVRTNPSAYRACLVNIDAQMNATIATTAESLADNILQQFGATNKALPLSEIAKTAIKNKVVELVTPYQGFVPYLMAVAALTVSGILVAIVKFLVPILVFLIFKAMLMAKFLSVEKVKMDVDVVK